MVGTFANTLPARILVREQEWLMPWLRGVQASVDPSRALQTASPSKVAAWVGAGPGAPLFESVLFTDGMPDPRAIGEGLERLRVSQAAFLPGMLAPLAIVPCPGESVGFRIHHDPRRFAAEDVRRVGHQLCRLLEEMILDPHRPLGDVPMMSEFEESQLHEWGREGVLPAGESPAIEDLTEEELDALIHGYG